MTQLDLLVRAAFEADLAGEQFDGGAISQADQRAIAQSVLDNSRTLAYTAFDGDNFWLVDSMRAYTIARGVVPANPESLIGYKDSVDRRVTKSGVLRDDLAVLKGCDELWIFADIEPEIEALATLAEGVLVELCFFALSHPPFDLKLIPIRELLGAQGHEPKTIRVDWHLLGRALPAETRSEILNLLGGERLQVRSSLPVVSYFCYELSDSKYVNWMRPFAYNEELVSVVPTLAVDINDFPSSNPRRLFDLLCSWSSLMRLARRAWFLPPMSGARRGPIANMLRQCWSKDGVKPSGEVVEWSRLRVPKALLGTSWPITTRERVHLPDGETTL